MKGKKFQKRRKSRCTTRSEHLPFKQKSKQTTSWVKSLIKLEGQTKRHAHSLKNPVGNDGVTMDARGKTNKPYSH